MVKRIIRNHRQPENCKHNSRYSVLTHISITCVFDERNRWCMWNIKRLSSQSSKRNKVLFLARGRLIRSPRFYFLQCLGFISDVMRRLSLLTSGRKVIKLNKKREKVERERALEKGNLNCFGLLLLFLFELLHFIVEIRIVITSPR